jgi:hypothetical protein
VCSGDGADRAGDLAARRTLRAGAEQRVDDNALPSHRLRRHKRLRERALGPGIVGLRWRHLGHGDAYARGRERAGKHPTVPAVVARAGEEKHAVVEQMRKTPHDLGGGRRARTLHQRARGDSRCRGIAIERGSVRGAQHAHRACHVPISAAAYPTTRS